MALSYLDGYNVWFVGDRCTGNGNDKEIYDILKIKNKSFQTTGPNKTIELIRKLILNS